VARDNGTAPNGAERAPFKARKGRGGGRGGGGGGVGAKFQFNLAKLRHILIEFQLKSDPQSTFIGLKISIGLPFKTSCHTEC
jgi:hypothetical protein